MQKKKKKKSILVEILLEPNFKNIGILPNNLGLIFFFFLLLKTLALKQIVFTHLYWNRPFVLVIVNVAVFSFLFLFYIYFMGKVV